MPTKRVFLCHSTKDKGFVDRLASDLERVNVGVWYAKWEIKVGDSLIEKINEGLRMNDYIAIVLTPDSMKSEWAKREINAGLMRELDEKRVVLLPLLVLDCDLPPLLKEKKWADFRTNYEEGFREFLFALVPESGPAILNSSNFRNAQYLISGLSASDEKGSNTLNIPQLKKIYRFRHELQGFLGPEERRLIFWSAVGFRRINPNIPFFMDISTPIWGLIKDTPKETYAHWILEGLDGPLFDYLAPYFYWASKTIKNFDLRNFKEAYIKRNKMKQDWSYQHEPISKNIIYTFNKTLAQYDDELFYDIYLPGIKKSKTSQHFPAILETTAFLTHPPDDDYYFSFANYDGKMPFSAVKALASLKRPSAVKLLKQILSSLEASQNSSSDVDKCFYKIGESFFVQELKLWLEEEQNVEICVRIYLALANAGCSANLDAKAIKIIKNLEKEKQSSLIPLVLRGYGKIGLDPTPIRSKLNSGDPLICEAAIFALGRLEGPKAISHLLPLLQINSAIIQAAVIEVLGKIGKLDIYQEIRGFSRHESALVKSGFYRALLHIRPSDWQNYLPLALKEEFLLRLCVSRVFACLADPEILNEWVDDKNMDETFRLSADEMLFAPTPFAPQWISNSDIFDPSLATLPVRLTNFDSDRIESGRDEALNRILYYVAYDKDLGTKK
jgi:hypothetical protein